MSRNVLKALFSSFLTLTLLAPVWVSADTLSVIPSSGSYKVGQTFSVKIVASSQSQAINAVSATLSFPRDLLQVTSISKIGSILNLWVAEPSFSNSQGTVSLEGVVPNPGFVGSSGPVLTVNFRVIKEGTATLNYASGQLLANDGMGTNVLRVRNSASFSLLSAPVTTNPEPEVDTNIKQPTVEEVTAPEPTNYIDLNQKPESSEVGSKTIKIEVPRFADVYDSLVRFLSLAIPLVALFFFLVHTFKRGKSNIDKLRRQVKKDLHGLDQLLDKSFDLLREDVSESIHILESARMKRKLTTEEESVIHRLRQNLVEAEKIIHREVVKTEKDVDS